MTEPPPGSQIASLLQEMKAAQLKAARLGLVLTASLIGMAVLNIDDESTRRDETTQIDGQSGIDPQD